ncbi:SAM and SH3 domain-containing protein 1-like isoform X2 [Brachyhypopomus gauderio]|uniref:SAM and SH3 domain-containing protein 1 isoform X2 n=1 Tax=Brachyhypopomus gauderio TaxID=698409 RepID=UPI00404199DD
MEQDRADRGSGLDANAPDDFSHVWADLMNVLDGSLGNLEDLAKEYSEYYSTSYSDVCDRMEELRKRRVAQDTETEKSEATTTSLQLRSEIQESLGLCSAVSTPEMERRLSIHKSSSEDGSGGRWDTRKKNKSFWQNFRKTQKGSIRQISKGEDVGFVASEITMSDEERIQLMMMVKEKMITVEEALARLKEYETQSKQSCNMDPTEWTDCSGPAVNESSNCNEQTDEELEESVSYRRLHKLVTSTRRVRKKLIRIDEGKKSTSKDPVSSDVSPTAEDNVCLYSGVQKRVAVPHVNGPASVPQEHLPADGDADVLTASPLSCSLDVYSSHRLFKGFSKPCGGSPGSGQVALGPSGASLALVPISGSSSTEAEGCGEEQPRMARSVTDGEMRRALTSSSYHGRACSFGGFDLMNRSIYMGNKNCDSSQGDGGGGSTRSPTPSRISLGKKVKSVKETMRKRISKKSSSALPEQSSPSRVPGSPQSPHTDTHSLEKPKLKAGGSVESLRSSLSGQSSMSGQTVSTTDSSASNRESVKSEEGEDDELPYRGPFCGRALVHTDFIPSPYDTDSLKLKRGDVIDIISKPPMGTWMGLLNNKVGTFKFIYVDVLSEEEKPKRSVRKKRKSQPPKPTSVEELLERINLKEHMPTFLFNGYEDLDTFRLLEQEDLDELNITDPQHRAVLLTAVELLQEYESNSDPERGGFSGCPEEKVLSESQAPPGDSPRDSGCFESNENLENGRCKKTSHLSRSSSGFESSHLPSPEYPTPPLSQPSQTTVQNRHHPQDLLLPFQMTTITGLCFGTSHCLLRAKSLSQSSDALVCLPAPQGLWKRCLSLDDLLPDQVIHRKETYIQDHPKRGSVEMQGLDATEALVPEKPRTCTDLEGDSDEPGTGVQPPVTHLIAGVAFEEVLQEENPAEAHAEDPPKCTLRIKPPVPPKPLPLLFIKEKEAGPDNKDSSPDLSLPQQLDTASNVPRSSKLFIHRLGKKVQHGKATSLESLVEEKLISDGIDLTEEPYSDKLGRYGVPFSLIQRYSEDLDKPLGDIATVMDHTRVQQLLKQHRMAIPLRGLSEICVKL